MKRSDIPAVTHVDYSARIQTVRRETNPLYWEIIDAFRELTGCPLIVNTSFNVRGEPIVCSPEDSYRCFMRTEMDFPGAGEFCCWINTSRNNRRWMRKQIGGKSLGATRTKANICGMAQPI